MQNFPYPSKVSAWCLTQFPLCLHVLNHSAFITQVGGGLGYLWRAPALSVTILWLGHDLKWKPYSIAFLHTATPIYTGENWWCETDKCTKLDNECAWLNNWPVVSILTLKETQVEGALQKPASIWQQPQRLGRYQKIKTVKKDMVQCSDTQLNVLQAAVSAGICSYLALDTTWFH